MNWKPPAPIDASPENRARVSGPGLRTLFNVAPVWELDVAEIRTLLGMPTSDAFQTRSDAARADEPLTLETDVLLRISAVLGIFKSLRLLEETNDESSNGSEASMVKTPSMGKRQWS
ncbi:hypothetical protein AB6806_26215 [Bosea sp. RCC_152_1]|uniref:hypothetical protein n=1 Tax=Bosea sp. RCC_152_1 TaxID=3239228 RepID=UPI00352629DD